MVGFAEVLANTVIFLFQEGGVVPIGTAFMIAYPVAHRSDAAVPLVVTAKHVIGDRDKVIGRFTAKSGTQPLFATYDLAALRGEGDLWEHPDDGVDLLLFRSLHFEQAKYEPVPVALIASRQTYAEEEITPTDRIIFPCLLVNFMGTARNYPVVRDGSIALIPDESVPLEYLVGARRVRTNQQVVLIDATSIPGASGSPVFLWPGPRVKGRTFTVGGVRPWLLGIMHGFYPALPREVVQVQQTATVVPGFAENSGIAIVFPSWRLLEILERDEVAERLDELLKGQT